MIFPNKTNKKGTKSEEKRSLRAAVNFFMGNAQTEANEREMKEKKKHRDTSNDMAENVCLTTVVSHMHHSKVIDWLTR